MNKFIATLVIVAAVAVNTASAFTAQPAPLATRSQQKAATIGPSFDIMTPSSSTALNLKVKVDPNAKTKNDKGNAKMAAYGGSIVFAALLPIAFLVWSAVSK
eukprot:CAMPEP_0181105398 /NCGR_PEP_ID=MMETSP1071-20121207/15969_1 /TAXON_ID=35127 /ORGANISM="Thalassiosira sp., Strain NH16" /LENGTH=101 /DNA_ID=CAMNT_0023188719 /DNA_START=173 /DNA_END=478 /DNA_ORIENTATION=+